MVTHERRITDRHQRVLQFIRSELGAKQRAPTRRELARHFNWWPNAVQDALKSLARSGAIRVLPRKRRGIEILSP